MSKSYVLAIDAGTGSGRAIIYDLTGKMVGSAQEEWVHPIVKGIPGAMEFDTHHNGALIDRVIRKALRISGLSPDQIKAVSTTSMREGFVLYDAGGEVLWACPNIDGRARDQAQALTDAGISNDIFKTAGDWVSLTAPARLLWIKDHQPEVLAKARHFGMLSDWIATRLTGEYLTDPSIGSSSALFDLGSRRWADHLFELVGIDQSIFPNVVESGQPIGVITSDAAERCGLASGTPVVAGGADTQLALLGLGRGTGQATLVGGSFWQMTILTEQPLIDPNFGPRTLCHARADQWMTEGIGFLSGFALRWLRDAFFEPVQQFLESGVNGFDIIEALAAQENPGAGGVCATAAGPMVSDNWHQPPLSFLGLDMNAPGRALGQQARAVMETGAFIANTHLKKLETLSGQTYETIQFTGGSSQGQLWPQIIADVTGRPIEIPVVKETTALGCAMLAAVGADLFETIDEAFSAMASPIERCVTPRPDQVAAYQDIQTRWREITIATAKLAERNLVNSIWSPAGARTNSMTPFG